LKIVSKDKNFKKMVEEFSEKFKLDYPNIKVNLIPTVTQLFNERKELFILPTEVKMTRFPFNIPIDSMCKGIRNLKIFAVTGRDNNKSNETPPSTLENVSEGKDARHLVRVPYNREARLILKEYCGRFSPTFFSVGGEFHTGIIPVVCLTGYDIQIKVYDEHLTFYLTYERIYFSLNPPVPDDRLLHDLHLEENGFIYKRRGFICPSSDKSNKDDKDDVITILDASEICYEYNTAVLFVSIHSPTLEEIFTEDIKEKIKKILAREEKNTFDFYLQCIDLEIKSSEFSYLKSLIFSINPNVNIYDRGYDRDYSPVKSELKTRENFERFLKLLKDLCASIENNSKAKEIIISEPPEWH
jgi:hypothetical protein